ncbi:hypothetical protein K0H19_01120 [Phocaeicola vulgatus]|jgi:hypothetical protein|uniref:PL29 family lyase N-terminal domain-containing protein n=1 Tax=Phocaeicola vulgatus TaxID=821 RepID=UPI001F480911|nr:PL29 family lyase N-terminal domain-containing protein [Phocaeicola vulgatus]MCE9350785.1 hypothetical protein [Phocaeicola vulgatus]MDU7570316.1 PL29 family lyase N-terminal domain-containing protein [Bacteroides sp.]
MERSIIGKNVIRKMWIAGFVMCAFGLPSCSDDYDDSELRNNLENLEDRITALEEWQKSVNMNIQSLQSIVSALENRNFITGVTPLMENGKETGYTITFQSGSPIIIRHGKDGSTPVIGVAKDSDGVYYWTVDGEFLLDGDKKIPVTGPEGDKGDAGDDGITPHIGENGNWWIGTTDTGIKAQGEQGPSGITPHIGENGNWWIGTTDTGIKAQGAKGDDAIAPQVQINATTNEWEISTDGGKNWKSTGIKATGEKGDRGDAVFAENGVDYTSDPDNVIFTLADGKTKLTVPRTKTLSVKFKDGCDIFSVTSVSNTIDIEFIGLTTENYKALVAELRSEDGTTDIDIVTRAENKDVEIKEPVFTTDGKCTGTTVKINKKGISGEKAVLKVTLIDNNGQEISVSRIVKFFGSGALDEAAQNGGSFTLSDDIILEKPVEVAKGKELVLDLNGKTISNSAKICSGNNWSAISVQGGTLIVKNGTIKAKENDCYVFDVRNGGKLIIESGVYIGNISAIYCYEGEVIVKGGEFSIQQKSDSYGDYRFLCNCQDKNYQNGTAKISISGGTFVGFNPANNLAEGKDTNFLAQDGKYMTVKTSELPDPYGTWEVKEYANSTSFQDIINNSEGAAVYLPEAVSFNDENVVLDGGAEGVTLQGNPVYFSGTNVSVKGITFDNGHSANGNGSAVYVNGGQCKNITFENCTFTNSEWDAIQLTDKDISSVTIKNCTFKNTVPGYRYIHLELRDKSAYTVNENARVEITGCTFENISKDYCKDSAITILGFKFKNMTIQNNIVKGAGADKLTTDIIWICDGIEFGTLMPEEELNKAFIYK